MKKCTALLTLLTTTLIYGETLEDIKEKAIKEGEVISVGMPDNWANWKDTWEALKNSNFKVSPGEVGTAAQASSAILAAAYALGGDEKNLKPAIKYFADLAKQGRLSAAAPNIQNLERGEIEVGLIWDFNGLSYRDTIDKNRFEVLIPSDGSLISGYTTIINKWAKNPNAAKLTREFIFSDEGQINLAKGNARPIRNVELPADVKAKMIPDDQYKGAKSIKNHEAWDNTSKNLGRVWQEEVLVNRK